MGPFVAHLTLLHFRSHKRTRVGFDGRPVALFGANGAGKTNVLEALSLLSPGRGLRRASGEELARRPEALGWKLSAEISGPQGPRQIETWAEPGQTRQLRIDDKAASQTALGQIMAMVWLTPVMDRLWLEGAEGRRRFLDRLTLSFCPDHAAQTLAYEKAMRQRNRLLRDQVQDGAWYGALEAQMAQSGAQITANRLACLAALARYADLGSAFPAADLTLDCTAPRTEDDLVLALADGRGRDLAAGRSLTGPHRADLGAIWSAKGAPAAQCSTGEQKALLISLILANARALTQMRGAAPVVLLDEVAAHLDADRRAALYDEICALKTQAFMTGTGPELFTGLGPRAQGFALSDMAGDTRIKEIDL